MSDLTPFSKRARPAPGRAALSKPQKAAIIVHFLNKEGANLPISALPDEMQALLTQQMGNMRYIDNGTLRDVINEFANELDGIGLAFPDGIAGALNELDGKISMSTAARLRRKAGVRQTGDPWERISKLDPPDLVQFAQAESPEVSAVILSKLDTNKAAEILALIPGDQARRITYSISLTENVTPETVEQIGLSIVAQLDNQPPRAFVSGPAERVGEILNSSTSGTRDTVLEGLDEADRDFAEKVRREIFTFAHIPERIAARDIPKIVRESPQDELLAALEAANQNGLEEVTEFILNNMSGRMAGSLREEMSELGKIKESVAEEAMSALVTLIRKLVSDGEIIVVSHDQDNE